MPRRPGPQYRQASKVEGHSGQFVSKRICRKPWHPKGLRRKIFAGNVVEPRPYIVFHQTGYFISRKFWYW